jgi:hypothetical protein
MMISLAVHTKRHCYRDPDFIDEKNWRIMGGARKEEKLISQLSGKLDSNLINSQAHFICL